MHRQHWFSHSKGAKKKGGNGKKEADDDIGEFGAEFESASVSNSTNRWQPQKIFKGPNSVTIQLSSPSTFAIEGRNKKIRDTIKAMVGSRLDQESGAYEFDLDRLEGVKNALTGLGYEVNDIPPEVIRVVEEYRIKSLSYSEVDMTLMPPLVVDSMLPFQRAGVEFAIQRGGKALICDDMGLGKTIQGIAIASYYMDEWPCLILAPSSLKRVWSAEFEKWIPGTKSHVHVVESSDDFKVAQVTIVAYDLAAKMVEKLSKSRFKVILADESHMLKSPTAQRTKTLVPLLRGAKRSVLLSGTPALSRPSELFPQLLALDASIWTRMKQFGIRYCNAHETPYGWDYTGHSNLIELNAVLTNTVMIRRLKTAVLTDLPEKVRVVIQIELSVSPDEIEYSSQPESNINISKRLEIMAKQEADRMRDIEGDGDSKVSSAGPRKASTTDEDILKLYREASQVKQEGVRKYIRQVVDDEDAVALSQPSLPSWIPKRAISQPKLDVKKGRKFLVFAHHLPMLDAIEDELKSLGVSYFRIDGETSTKDRAAYVKRFEQEEALRVAVLSLTCASTGLTLISASLVLFAELFWNPGTLIQAEDRVHRLGQTAPFVELRYLFCKGTVDDQLWPLIDKKLKVVGSAINGAKDQMSLDGKRSPKSKITDINKKKPKEEKLEPKKEKPKLTIKELISAAPSRPPPKRIDTIIIDDSQESISLYDAGDKKRILEEPEEIEIYLPSPKRPNLSVSYTSEYSDTELDNSAFQLAASPPLKSSSAPTERPVSTPIRHVTLSFLTPNPVRLGLKK